MVAAANLKSLRLIALVVALGAAVYSIWPSSVATPEPRDASSKGTQNAHERLEPNLKTAPNSRVEPSPPRRKVNLPKSEEPDEPTPQEVNTQPRPPCESDSDCRGIRTADCIRATCQDGACVTDESACGCTSSDQCEDNDPCTRNHCFARTKECIFIPQDCEK